MIGLGLFGGAAVTLNMTLFYMERAGQAGGDSVAANLAIQTRLSLFGSALVFAVGSVLFGIAMLRARRYPSVPVWAYTTVLPVFALAGPLPDSPRTVRCTWRWAPR